MGKQKLKQKRFARRLGRPPSLARKISSCPRCFLSFLVVMPPCHAWLSSLLVALTEKAELFHTLSAASKTDHKDRGRVMAQDAGNRKGQKQGAFSLSGKQERAILAVLESRSIEEACRKAGISKTLYYRWLNDDPGFADALKDRRDAASSNALERLQGSVSTAVDVLVDLLASENEWVRRVAANDVMSRFLKAKELGELEERLARLESAMSNRNNA